MNASKNLIDDYYFVPIGREPGSYLDVLGLPPTATEEEVKRKDTEYLKKLERDYKNGRKEYREKLKNKEITEEEFNGNVKKLEEEKREKEIKISKLKEKYDLELAEKRKLKQLGLKDDIAVWVDMYESFLHASEAHCLEKFFLKKNPFPQIEPPQLGSIPPHDHYRNSNINDISTKSKNLHNDFDTMALSLLLKTDELWSKLKYTHIEFWLNEIYNWNKELDSITPRLKIIPLENKNQFNEPDFPTLCQPFNLTIEHINDEEVENLFKMPERKGELKPISLAELLAEILARNKTTAGENPEDLVGDNSGPVSIEHMFMDLLNNLLFNPSDANKYNI